jgi:DNA polymerase
VSGLDYETWSRTNLPVRGLDNYVKDPEFKTLLASVSDSRGQRTYDWVFGTIWWRGRRVTDSSGLSWQQITDEFRGWLDDHKSEQIMAHNVGFERAVTQWLFPDFDVESAFRDSAVDARMVGAESKLEVASRQLTNSHKLEAGRELVMLFCVPNEYYPDGPTPELIEKHGHMDKWMLFIEYCEMDAKGSEEIREVVKSILDQFDPDMVEREGEYELATYEMNQVGWAIDEPLMEQMARRKWANDIIAQKAFHIVDDQGQQVMINFNSPKQLKHFCEVRGVKITSLDKYHLPIVLKRVKARIEKLTAELADDDDSENLKYAVGQLEEVESLLETKLEIGGTTLQKLPVIKNLLSADGRLRNQYMHFGAGQTGRSTSVGAQLQNISKLELVDGEVRDVSTLYDYKVHWSNGDMSGQIRQLFIADQPDGETLVGDFSGVESRGLAYSAEEEWKLQVFRDGRDVYKELFVRFTNGEVKYEEVTKEQRPRGKYSELSCGYQASAVAVQDFMFRLGFDITIEEAAENVIDWRSACPAIVKYWSTLDDILKDAVRANMQLETHIGYGMKVRVSPFTLASMSAQHPGSVSLCIQIILPDGKPFVTRFVHGCYFKGNKLCYYKPADKNTGELWKATYKHPKLKDAQGKPLEVFYSIYGGKLAGILTQSLCREIFFESLMMLRAALKGAPNVHIVGQFHDEINVYWHPSTEAGALNRETVEAAMELCMSTTRLQGFPLIADIKSAYRYIK